MQYISEVPWPTLKVGDKCISTTDTSGKIIDLISIEHAARQEDNEVVILWDNGKISHFWHYWGDKIKYVGPS